MLILTTTESSTKPQIYRTYTNTDRKNVVDFYDQHDCKVTALKLIRANAGYETLTERKIHRWMNALGIKKCAGRPVCDQFEAEVLAECDKCAQQLSESTYSHRYSYAFVRECGHRVLNNYYWDEDSSNCSKKWLLDKRTRHLKLTNKWVSGLLRRSSAKTCSAASITSTATLDEPVQAQESPDDVSVVMSGSVDDFSVGFDWDLLLLED